MKTALSSLLLFALSCVPHPGRAQDTCPDRSAYAPAREIVADLQRITAPEGVQEACAILLVETALRDNVRCTRRIIRRQYP